MTINEGINNDLQVEDTDEIAGGYVWPTQVGTGRLRSRRGANSLPGLNSGPRAESP